MRVSCTLLLSFTLKPEERPLPCQRCVRCRKKKKKKTEEEEEKPLLAVDDSLHSLLCYITPLLLSRLLSPCGRRRAVSQRNGRTQRQIPAGRSRSDNVNTFKPLSWRRSKRIEGARRVCRCHVGVMSVSPSQTRRFLSRLILSRVYVKFVSVVFIDRC